MPTLKTFDRLVTTCLTGICRLFPNGLTMLEPRASRDH